MKKQLFMLIAACTMTAAASQATIIYGYQTWEPMTDNPMRGPVKFDSSSPGDMTIIADCSDMGVVYGGYYYNYHWYGQGIVKGTQSSVEGVYDIDLTTGERTLLCKGGTKMIDLTYNYATDKVLGIRTGSSILAEFDPTTGQSSIIGRFSYEGTDAYMLAIAASLDGVVYGVSTDDYLYKINPSDASLTRVGHLGADAGFDQTMAFDYATGTLYWANNADYILYTINTSTGKATEIGPLGLNGVSSMGSLFIPFINVPQGSPDRVTNITARGNAASATLTWTNPILTAQGEELTSLQGVIIKRDGLEIANVKTLGSAIGQPQSYEDKNLEDGHDYAYEIIPYNAAGRGGVDTYPITVHIGKDRPAKVTDLTATQGDGSAILTWKAPAEGASGGMFDPADITGYEVKRGNRVIATTQPSQLTYEDATSFGTYEYTVTALSKIGNGEPSTISGVLVKPSSWIIMHHGTEKLATGMEYEFYDEGGPNGQYYNSRNHTLTLAPAEAGCYIVAEFSEFSVETYGDYLSIYQGTGTDGELYGKFNSTSLPAGLRHVESTAADGALTFVFSADVLETAPGWKAIVKSLKPLAADMEASAISGEAMAVAGEKASFTVTVTNKGTTSPSTYKIELLCDGTTVASSDGQALPTRGTASVKLEFTPTTAADCEITARVVLDGDEDISNNTTEPLQMRVLPAGSAFIDLFAPEPANLFVMPFSFMSNESISEVILTADELTAGKDRELSILSYPLSKCDEGYLAVPFEIWVGETVMANLADGIAPASQLTKVFDSTVDIPSGSSEITFNLSTVYHYKGGNLAIMIHKKFSATANSGITMRGTYDYGGQYLNRTRFASGYDESEPLDPNTTFGYAAQNQRSDIRLVFGAGGGGISDTTIDICAAIHINGRSVTLDDDAIIYTPAGTVVAAPSANSTVQLAPGIYIVASGIHATKIAIK
ncbi:MAG: hypothetical protein NC405_08685 [Odoribacter sp.]|nr:hypothetical protein [Odoribacter sp.]